jgi:hypothetical protein
MLAYFPTEQLYYLRVHEVIPAAITLPILGKPVALNAKKLLLVSSKFYLAYIFLEFLRLKERAGLLYTKQKVLSKASAEKAKLKYAGRPSIRYHLQRVQAPWGSSLVSLFSTVFASSLSVVD